LAKSKVKISNEKRKRKYPEIFEGNLVNQLLPANAFAKKLIAKCFCFAHR
jgi:hypothetical protein